MSDSKSSRTRLIVALLVGSIVPVVVGTYLLPQYLWWLFGVSCAMVLAGSAFLVLGSRDEPDAS